MSNSEVYTILCDSRNNIWVGCYGGGVNLLQETPEGAVRFINHRNKLKNYFSYASYNIRCMAEAEDGVILIGTTKGLLTFSNSFDQPEEIKFYRNIQRNGSYPSLMGNDIMHIYINSHKKIYLLTFTGGINEILSDDLLLLCSNKKNGVGTFIPTFVGQFSID
ncbi:MAG: hypothetical protein LUD15_01210, partial [Bacteroides sp.]|nr:hypothetical protein [Bacteroides sp.]